MMFHMFPGKRDHCDLKSRYYIFMLQEPTAKMGPLLWLPGREVTNNMSPPSISGSEWWSSSHLAPGDKLHIPCLLPLLPGSACTQASVPWGDATWGRGVIISSSQMPWGRDIGKSRNNPDALLWWDYGENRFVTGLKMAEGGLTETHS